MRYTNSPLVSHIRISPNKTPNRRHSIDTITIHCVVGQCSVETMGDIFAPSSFGAAPNYGVGPDGRIGLYVEEKDRAWCTGGKDENGNPIRVNGISGSDNDHRAITIEVASDRTDPYAVTDEAIAGLIDLLVDICLRNNIPKLLWKADKSLVGQVDKQNMTVHRWFANKECPGAYLYDRHAQIAAEVNRRLGVSDEEDAPVERPGKVSVGDIVTFNGTKHYASANSTTAVSCRPGKAQVTQIFEKGKHPYHLVRVAGGSSNVYGWVDANDIWELGRAKETYNVGDLVEFSGDQHFPSANASSAHPCKPGKAKITAIHQLGKSKHPYHLIRVGGDGCTVYGWVDADTFSKV